jgi:hypothetical protein
VQPADLLQAPQVLGPPARDLDERRVGEHGGDRLVLRARRLLAPLDELARDGADRRLEPADARQPVEDDVEVALVGRRLEHPALLARPLEASSRRSSSCSAPASCSRCRTSSRAYSSCSSVSGRASQRVKLALLRRRTPSSVCSSGS